MCSRCGKSGHDSRSCPSRKQAAAKSTGATSTKDAPTLPADRKRKVDSGASNGAAKQGTAAPKSAATKKQPAAKAARAVLKKEMETVMKAGNWDEVFRLLRDAPDLESWVYESYELSLASGPDAIQSKADTSDEESSSSAESDSDDDSSSTTYSNESAASSAVGSSDAESDEEEKKPRSSPLAAAGILYAPPITVVCCLTLF